MDAPKHSYMRSFFLACGAYALCLVIMVFTFMKGLLTTYALGGVSLGLMAAFFLVFLVVLRRYRKNASTSTHEVAPKQLAKQIRTARIALIVLIVCNLFGNWDERAEPWRLRIIPNIVSLLLIWAFVTVLRNAQAKLKRRTITP